jgi:hypothetical protein
MRKLNRQGLFFCCVWALTRIATVSMTLHRCPTLLTRAVAVAAWALADRDLPRELVVNHAEKT